MAYQKIFNLTHIEELLEYIKVNYYKSALPNLIIEKNLIKMIPSFDEGFDESLK